MEDHMTSSDMVATGNSSVPMVTGSMGADPDLQVLCDRVKVLEQNTGSAIQSESYLWSRIRELERSEKSLLLQLYQLASASHLPSMQHSQRLDQRLHMLREEVRTMSQEKERGERAWRERLQRCQRQLKAKEEEMSRQSQYFENFKAQLQHKLILARDREQSLQNRIYTLEKQLLDMTVSAATGATTIGAVRITAGTLTQSEEQERLLSMRGEGEGEEAKKEERRKQWQPNTGTEREGRQEGDEGKTEKEGDRDTKQNSNEARLQGFILSLQEDLRVLLEREESGMTERRRLMEQLQEAQENSHFLCCKVEEMKAEVQQLKLSESSLMEEAEELREENHRLQQSLRDANNQTPSQSSTILDSTCPSPGTSSLSCSPVVCSVPSNTNATGRYSDESCGKVHSILDDGEDQPHSSAVAPVHHQATAESAQNDTEDPFSPVKPETLPPPEIGSLNRLTHLASKSSLSLQSLSVTTETIDEFKLGTWCSRGVLNLEETPSEESDALREAYKSLGLGEDLEALQEQRDRLEAALQHTQEQLQVMDQDNAELKSQLRKQAKEQETEMSPSQDNTILAQDDLVQALNQENRALADRIQELLAHIELREQEMKTEQTQLGEHIFRLKESQARLEDEYREQGCLITELTRKTEDDLNTIMELQQKLVESRECKEGSQVEKELCGSQRQSEHTASISGHNNQEECVDSLVESVLKGEESQLMSSHQPDKLITGSAPHFQLNKHNDSLQNSLQSNLPVNSLTDEVDQLTKSVQNLKTEQDELTGKINSLRDEQREVALSVQTQTEEKQHLTRTVWGLKEEKDCISQSLVGLKQDREHLTRTVCGLKDERDQFIRSMKSLKEEKEQLTTCLFGLEREKEKLLESLSSGKEEGDQTVQSLQRLQKESDQLSQTVLSLKLERDELTDSLKRLTEQRDQEQLSTILQEDRDKLLKSVCSLKEEKERIEHSISCLKQEEKQTMLLLQGTREQRNSLLTGFHSQTQTQERNQKHLLNQNNVGVKMETTVSGDNAAHRCQTNNYKGNSIQEQSDLMREIKALRAELKRSQEEVDTSHVETKRLHSELCQSEARREDAERRAAQAADKVMRLTDEANQMEETRMENNSLATQLKELQSKLTGLVKEKTNALTLKAQTEEQYNILTAQLKAKTVALEELNSEYIALKRGQGSRDDLSTVLMSLRTRYNDIRAKYEALLKKKSQTDLDVAPLKAKLSCLVMKCQERNNFLVQMMKVMHKHGCMDSTLTEQAEQLLSDAALQDYTAAFTPEGTVKTQNYSSGFTPGFILKYQDYSSGFTPDQTWFASILPVNQHQNGFTTESGIKCGKSEQQSSTANTEFTTNLQDCSGDIIPAPTVKKNANSPVPTSPEHDGVQVSPSPVPAKKEDLTTNTTQIARALSSPDPTSSSEVRRGSSLSPAPPSSATRVSPSRRLSSPEKIINLHEQLKKTLLNSYQSPVSRGRGEQPRKSLSFSAPADLSLSPQMKTQSLCVNIPPTNNLPVTTASSQAKHTPVVTTKPVATNKSTTLFNAVASRSANVSLSSNTFTKHHLKADISTTNSGLSSSSSSFINTVASNKEKSTVSSGFNIPISPKLKRQTPAIPDAKHTATTVRSAATGSNILLCLDTNPKTTASDTSAPSISTASKANILSMTSNVDGAASAYDGLLLTSSCIQPSHYSPERSSKSARKSPAALEKTKTPRPKPEAPADVRSVEVIKTVGQSSLMIGWERPPLDELGCSNGTFVYGYRVFVDGDFHKSVMSSACTKCILESVDLSVPLHISVQTLGSNGLSSNSVHTMYRTSVRTDHD